MMRKTVLALTIFAATMYQLPAMAFGSLLGAVTSLVGGAGSAPASYADPDGFVKNAQIAENLMRQSLSALSESLSTKEDQARIIALKEQASKITDAKEKEAVEKEIVKTQAASLSSVDFDKVASEDIAKMDDAQRGKIGAASFNFVLAMLKNKELVSQSSSLISQMRSNPMMLMKVTEIVGVGQSLASQVEMGGTLVTRVPKLFGAVGIKEAPTSTSAQPMEIAD